MGNYLFARLTKRTVSTHNYRYLAARLTTNAQRHRWTPGVSPRGRKREHKCGRSCRHVPKTGKINPVSELLDLIQAHLDRYGVTRSEFARRAGTTPQTVQNWKDRPTTLPRREHLEGEFDQHTAG